MSKEVVWVSIPSGESSTASSYISASCTIDISEALSSEGGD